MNTLSLSLLLLAGATDFLDGHLARRFALRTPLGAVIDPLADKLLVACTASALCAQGTLPGWIVAVVLARDAALVGCAAAVAPERRVAPTGISKVNTGVQIALCGVAVASGGDLAIVEKGVVEGLAVVAAGTTVGSGVSYAVRFWRKGR